MHEMLRPSRWLTAVLLLALPGAAAPAERAVRATATRSVTRDVKVDRNVNVNVNRNVHVDVNHYHGCCYRPAPPPGAVVATAVVTAAVVGSVVASLPPSCTTVIVNGFSYRQCGTVWYQPSFAGTSVTYVVVSPPR